MNTGSVALLLLGFALALWGLYLFRIGAVIARMFQIEEYEWRRLWRWSRQQEWHTTQGSLIMVAVFVLVGWVINLVWDWGSGILFFAFATGGLAAGNYLWGWPPAKKPLVRTPRMRRLALVATLLTLIMEMALGLLCWWLPRIGTTLLTALLVLSPIVVVADLVMANGAVFPIEARIRRHFLKVAEGKINRLQPTVVAVVGSYGKTSTKHLLARALSPSNPVFPTPKSFNTLMGVCRTINDDLAAEHRIFLVEMDAYGPGEIAAISHLTKPKHAIITSVGPQHLERFTSMHAIADALYEVVLALPSDGSLLVYGGEEVSHSLGERAKSQLNSVLFYGIEGQAPDLDVFARDITVEADGSHFQWQWPARGLQADVRLRLLGRHQVINATAVLAMTAILNASLEEAVAALQQAKPVDHRLQLLPSSNGIRVIDDSFNANPVGVHSALEVLSEFKGGQRILVTPGMVELGPLEETENERYGEHAAAVCDHVIVVKARPGIAVQHGLQKAGMAAERIHMADSLAEATQIIAKITKVGDVVLFANDLPDTY